ncbi:MAG TPA: ATP-binding protein [Usitatibacter sp.]|nr:ATP-binding protein [Usitatibacter sp.]
MECKPRARGETPFRAVVVTPNEVDGRLAADFLHEAGIAASVCESLAQLASIPREELGCVLLVEEALADPDIESFQRAIEAQPAWSDVPILLMASEGGAVSAKLDELFPDAGNSVLLHRPLPPWSLVSAVQVALRSRQRQFLVRDLLEERSRAVRQRDEFLAMLAHELRNPLAPIRNVAYVMGNLGIEDPAFIECRDIIEKQTRHMSRLVEDLVDASRLEMGKSELRRQPLDLNDCVVAAAKACRPMTGSHSHRVTIELAPEPLSVMADPVRIEQAISNLIVNATKFTPVGGSIELASAREADVAVVRVKDSGVGIDPGLIDSIFDLFTQGQVSLARSEGGLGIGLTLVKRLVEQHGGTVTASSEGAGKGSTFEMRLPLTEKPRERAPRAAARIPDSRRSRRILVIEDMDDVRLTLGMLLRSWHHEVSFASTGPEGLAMAMTQEPEIALVDIGLPGLDGYQIARAVRGAAGTWAKEVKLIALTGYGQASDREHALAAGFDVHIVKPVDPVELEMLLA